MPKQQSVAGSEEEPCTSISQIPDEVSEYQSMVKETQGRD